jgi:hypothetical protein
LWQQENVQPDPHTPYLVGSPGLDPGTLGLILKVQFIRGYGVKCLRGTTTEDIRCRYDTARRPMMPIMISNAPARVSGPSADAPVTANDPVGVAVVVVVVVVVVGVVVVLAGDVVVVVPVAATGAVAIPKGPLIPLPVPTPQMPGKGYHEASWLDVYSTTAIPDVVAIHRSPERSNASPAGHSIPRS